MLEAMRIGIQLIPGAYLEVEMLESINVFFMLSLMTWWLTFLNVDEPSSQSLGISYCWINLSLTNDSRWIIRWLWRFQLITKLRIRQISPVLNIPVSSVLLTAAAHSPVVTAITRHWAGEESHRYLLHLVLHHASWSVRCHCVNKL